MKLDFFYARLIGHYLILHSPGLARISHTDAKRERRGAAGARRTDQTTLKGSGHCVEAARGSTASHSAHLGGGSRDSVRNEG